MAYLMTKNNMQVHYRFLFIYIFLSIFSMTEGAGLQFSKEVPQTCLNLFDRERNNLFQLRYPLFRYLPTHQTKHSGRYGYTKIARNLSVLPI